MNDSMWVWVALAALARRLEGRRVALEGLVAPVPSGEAGWLALGETALVPCQLCGGPHDWPTGVVAVLSPAEPALGGLVSRIVPALVGGNAVVAVAAEEQHMLDSTMSELHQVIERLAFCVATGNPNDVVERHQCGLRCVAVGCF